MDKDIHDEFEALDKALRLKREQFGVAGQIPNELPDGVVRLDGVLVDLMADIEKRAARRPHQGHVAPAVADVQEHNCKHTPSWGPAHHPRMGGGRRSNTMKWSTQL